MIQDSFKIEAKFMETSDPMTLECKLFTHEFIGFRAIENKKMKLRSNTYYSFFPNIIQPIEDPSYKSSIKLLQD